MLRSLLEVVVAAAEVNATGASLRPSFTGRTEMAQPTARVVLTGRPPLRSGCGSVEQSIHASAALQADS